MSDRSLPQGWAVVQLNDLVKNPKSDLVDGPFGSNLRSNEYVESGIPVLKIQNIKANRFVEKRLSYVTPEKAEELSRHSFIAGDLMITKLGEPLGLCCEVPPHLKHGIFVADLMRLRPNPAIINSKFLLHAINSVVVQNQFKEITKGTTRQRVNLSIVRAISIELPPLNEQHRIVAKIEELFSELDKGIENLKTAQAQLKVYRQALLKHAFEGKLTAQWREQHRDQLETAALQQRIQQERAQRHQQQLADWEAGGKQGSKPKAPKSLPPLTAEELAELPELPEGWGWVTLAHIQSHENYAVKAGPFGSALKKEFYVRDGYKIYGQEQVIRGDSEYGDYFIDESKYKELASCAIRPFDVLISLVGTIGKVLVLPDSAKPGIINPRLVKISLNLAFYRPSFFKAYFESGFLRSLYANESQGTTMDILNLGMIQRLPYPLCSIAEQEKILEILDERFSEVDQLELTLTTSLQQAEALRQSILKRAFSGQLVPQDPHDEPATVLLERIRVERESNRPPKNKRIRK